MLLSPDRNLQAHNALIRSLKMVREFGDRLSDKLSHLYMDQCLDELEEWARPDALIN